MAARGTWLCGVDRFGPTGCAGIDWLRRRKARTRFVMTGESCLHCEINELVREHIDVAGDDQINLPDLVAKVGESLVDLILLGSEDQWGDLLAAAIRDIGQMFLEKSGAVEGETAH
jgi:hypothetical protein